MVPRRSRARVLEQVLNDLKTRGVRDILIACVDGLGGFPDAIEAIFPRTIVQTFGASREQVARGLKAIYTAIDADIAWGARALRGGVGSGFR